MMDKKYGKKVRFVFVIIIILSLIALSVANCIAMTKIISYYCGLNRNFVIAACSIISVIFVLIGGFKGISITSLIQAVLMVFSIIMLCLSSIHACGDISNIQAAASAIPDFNKLFSPSFPLSAGIGWTICMGFPTITSQDLHQKIISCKTDRDVTKALLTALAVVIILYGCGTIIGYTSIVWGSKAPDLANSEFFITWASKKLLGNIFTCICALGFVAAINTTLASTLSAASFSISRNLVYYYNREIDERSLLKITKVSAAGVAVISCMIAIVIPDILTAMYLTGNIMAGGLTLPVFAYFFSKKATSEGIFISSIIGTTFVIFDFTMRQMRIALPWPGEPFSIIITFVLSSVTLVFVSACTQKQIGG